MRHTTTNGSLSGLRIAPERSLTENMSHSTSISQTVPAGYPTKSLEKQRAVEEKICNYQSTNREKAFSLSPVRTALIVFFHLIIHIS